jgi:hypothetical protein
LKIDAYLPGVLLENLANWPKTLKRCFEIIIFN